MPLDHYVEKKKKFDPVGEWIEETMSRAKPFSDEQKADLYILPAPLREERRAARKKVAA